MADLLRQPVRPTRERHQNRKLNIELPDEAYEDQFEEGEDQEVEVNPLDSESPDRELTEIEEESKSDQESLPTDPRSSMERFEQNREFDLKISGIEDEMNEDEREFLEELEQDYLQNQMLAEEGEESEEEFEQSPKPL